MALPRQVYVVTYGRRSSNPITRICASLETMLQVLTQCQFQLMHELGFFRSLRTQLQEGFPVRLKFNDAKIPFQLRLSDIPSLLHLIDEFDNLGGMPPISHEDVDFSRLLPILAKLPVLREATFSDLTAGEITFLWEDVVIGDFLQGVFCTARTCVGSDTSDTNE